jgi:hypothetical protein
MKIQNTGKRALPHVGVALFFFFLTALYFYPVFEGKTLQQGDITNFKGMAHELEEYGKPSGWTGSMFGGMPSYQITGYLTGTDFVYWVRSCFLGVLPQNTMGPIFVFLLCAYGLFLVLGASWWLAALGAVAMAFSSYNIIIVEAGHVTKIWTLAFVPVVLSGLSLIFRQKYRIGFVVFTLGLALAIGANHLQVIYYAALFCAILVVGFWFDCLAKRALKRAGLATGVLAAGMVLALLASANGLYLNYESGRESTRGKAELRPVSASGADEVAPVSTGLEKDYVFVWSYGRLETFSLLIPNVMGGSSGGWVGPDSQLYRELRAHGARVGKDGVQTYTYWGDKPFTSGPVYFGAIVCFLFVLSFFVVPGSSKWWLLGAAVFFIFLAWGRHFAGFNDWMYYHFPFYGKFRTVETALVIPAFIFPMLAVSALRAMTKGGTDRRRLIRPLYLSAGITAGICLVLWWMPDVFFPFESAYDAGIRAEAPEWYYLSLLEDRKDLLSSDARRSLMFVVLAAGLIALFIRTGSHKKALPLVAGGVLLLVLVDLWAVDKRYLSEKNFLSARNRKEFSPSAADRAILQDTARSYRVLNLNNTFNESRTSYFHKSIGGYHAAKLGRYQDLIDRRLTKEIQALAMGFRGENATLDDLYAIASRCPTLNMLNAKYLIYDPEQAPLVNPYACGNAWFVGSCRFTDTPDEEMAALETLNPKTEAALDRQFEPLLSPGLQLAPDSAAFVEMTAYFPNRVEYQSSSSQAGLAVFSEIYYKKGWKAFIDGRPAPACRADWVLRALEIPAGRHRIEWVFDPDEVRVAGTVTTVFSGLLLLLVIAALCYGAGIRVRGGKLFSMRARS